MDVFVFVLAIVAIGTAGGIIKEAMKNNRKAGGQTQQEQEGRIETLEERVATLERIVTDEKYHLSREIDTLK